MYIYFAHCDKQLPNQLCGVKKSDLPRSRASTEALRHEWQFEIEWFKENNIDRFRSVCVCVCATKGSGGKIENPFPFFLRKIYHVLPPKPNYSRETKSIYVRACRIHKYIYKHDKLYV